MIAYRHNLELFEWAESCTPLMWNTKEAHAFQFVCDITDATQQAIDSRRWKCGDWR